MVGSQPLHIEHILILCKSAVPDLDSQSTEESAAGFNINQSFS